MNYCIFKHYCFRNNHYFMPKKYLTILLYIALVGILIYAYFYFSTLKNYKNNDSIKAVPTDASLIIQTQDPKKVINILLEDIKYKDALENFKWFQDFIKSISKIKKDSSYNTTVLNKLKIKPLTISFHREGKDKLKPLFLYPLSNKAEQNNIINYLKEQDGSLWKVKERKYNTSTVYVVKISTSEKSLFISFNQGFLIASHSSILVENSLRQLQTGFSLLADETFDKLYKTVGHNCEANIFVNFDNIPETLSLIFNSNFKNKLDVFKRMGKWGEFDISLKKTQILINGFLYPSPSESDIDILFEGIDGSSSKINEVIPSNSNYVLSYSFNKTGKLLKNLKNYLKNNNKIDDYNMKINNLKLSQEDAEKLIFDLIDDEFGLVYSNTNPLEKDDGKYFIIKTVSKTKTQNALKTLNNNSEIKPIDYYKLDNQVKYPIYKNSTSKIFKIALDYFCPNTPYKYYTFINNYLIFSDTKKSLSSIIYANILKKTLQNDKYHQQFLENFSYKDNMFIYCDISQLANLLPESSNFDIISPNKNQQYSLSKFYGLGIQVTNANNLLYTNICIEYLPKREKEPQTIWQSKLDSTIITKPTLVENHNTKEKEIFVQDKSYMIYLISNNGRILWKKKLDAPILSDIFQIDYYRNNKLQYLFNTKNKIFLIDRNGNPVDKYPINLAYKATNGLALLDYDKNRNYRIFLACNNHNTYAFDKKGNQIHGWKADPTEGIVSKPIQHFRIQEKDYIVFSDDKRNYILNRKGRNRVTIKPDFISNENSNFYETIQNSIPSIITTSINGNLKTINLITGECNSQKILKSPEPHKFIAYNFSHQEGMEWVTITKNNVSLKSALGKTIFNTKINGNILLEADIYYFSSSNKKIGVFDSNNKKIYLINNDGSIYKNFPLKGQSRFSIGFLNSSSHKFNLIVGGEDNYLYNYQIE